MARGKKKEEKLPIPEPEPEPERKTPPAVEQQEQEENAAEPNENIGQESGNNINTSHKSDEAQGPIPAAASQGNTHMEEIKERSVDRKLREAIEEKRKQNEEDEKRRKQKEENTFMKDMAEALQRGTNIAKAKALAKASGAQPSRKATTNKKGTGFRATKRQPRKKYAASHRTQASAEENQRMIRHILLRNPNTRGVVQKMKILNVQLTALSDDHMKLQQNVYKMSTYIHKRQEIFAKKLDEFKKKTGKKPSEFKKAANSYNDFTKQQIKGALDEAEKLIKEYNDIKVIISQKEELEKQEKEITKKIEDGKKYYNSLTRKHPREIIRAKKLEKTIRGIKKREEEEKKRKENISKMANNV